jgi:hypothetical protein
MRTLSLLPSRVAANESSWGNCANVSRKPRSKKDKKDQEKKQSKYGLPGSWHFVLLR